MSRPERSLKHRNLPPLVPTNGFDTGQSKACQNKLLFKSVPTSDPGAHVKTQDFDITPELVTIYLHENPDFLEKYILDYVSVDQLRKWRTAKSPSDMHDERSSMFSTGKTPRLDNYSTMSRGFLDQNNAMQTLAQQMSLHVNCAPLLNELRECLARAVDADGSNLYLVDNSENEIYFYNPLTNNDKKNSPCVKKICKGSTLAAYVAHSKLPERINDIGSDDRWPEGLPVCSEIVQSVLAQPIVLQHGVVAGVIELYRTTGRSPFLLEDSERAIQYSIWAGVAVQYIDVFQKTTKQQRLNHFILEVTQSMFGKFKNMDNVVLDIMSTAQELVKADRASLFLVDYNSRELNSRIFDVRLGEDTDDKDSSERQAIRFPMNKGIAGHVATTGETLNIADAYMDSRFNREIDQQTGYTTKSILCMPVKMEDEIIGVVQMLNKLGGAFTEEDEDDFRTFATYCGLALHIAKMYEKINRSEQKYKVALEVLSYHSQYTLTELSQLRAVQVPKFIHGITEVDFSPWGVDEFHKPLYCIYMFRDLFGLGNMQSEDNEENNRRSSVQNEQFRFDHETLMKFVLTVRKNYRKVPYHNWAHAFSVAHSMYVILKSTDHTFTLVESLAAYIACLCHDLDHRGKTNQYMVKSSAVLADIYSTSTMEHHHFNMTISILQREGHNIFQNLSSETYKEVLGTIKHCILATDLAKFFGYKASLEKIVTENRKIDWQNDEHRNIVMAICMTTCDLCSMFKPWRIQLGLVMVIMEEFWIQGDDEKTQNQTPLRMMDRDFKHELPESQVGFIKAICLPCYTVMSKAMPALKPMVQGAKSNLKKWEAMAALPLEAKTTKLAELDAIVRQDSRTGRSILIMT